MIDYFKPGTFVFLKIRVPYNNEIKNLRQRTQIPTQFYLTTIAGAWYFGRVLVPQRLINLSLYHEILLLQKFNDTGGKVLKPKKISLQPQKKNEAVYDCV